MKLKSEPQGRREEKRRLARHLLPPCLDFSLVLCGATRQERKSQEVQDSSLEGPVCLARVHCASLFLFLLLEGGGESSAFWAA